MKNTLNVTLKDVAREAGMSLSSTSRAFGHNACGYLSKDKKDCILKAAKRLGYRPQVYARRLVKRNSFIIGMGVSSNTILDNFGRTMEDTVLGFIEGAKSEGFDALPFFFEDFPDKLQIKDFLLKNFNDGQFDAIILGNINTVGDDLVEELLELGCKIIVRGNYLQKEGLLTMNVNCMVSYFRGLRYFIEQKLFPVWFTFPFRNHYYQNIELKLKEFAEQKKITKGGLRFFYLDGEISDKYLSNLLIKYGIPRVIMPGDEFAAWNFFISLENLGISVPEAVTVAGACDMRGYLFPCPILIREKSNIREMYYVAGQLMSQFFGGKQVENPDIIIESVGGDVFLLESIAFKQLAKLKKEW